MDEPAAPPQEEPSGAVLPKKKRKKPKRKRKKPSTPEEKAKHSKRKGDQHFQSRERDREAKKASSGGADTSSDEEGDDGSTKRPEGPTAGIKFHKNKAETNSSSRILLVAKATETPTERMSRKKRWRANKKQRKIGDLPKVVAQRVAASAEAGSATKGGAKKRTKYELNPHFYFSTDAAQSAKDAFESNKDEDWVKVTYDSTTMNIEDDPSAGRHYVAADGTFIATLLPREWALEDRNTKNVIRHVATHEFVLKKVTSIKRGKSHLFNAKGGYAILGDKASQNGGVTNTECPSVDEVVVDDVEYEQALAEKQERLAGDVHDDDDCVVYLSDEELLAIGAVFFNAKKESETIRNRVQSKVDAYIPSRLFHGLREGLKKIDFKIKGRATTTSSAWSRDFQAAMHIDKDAFLSYLTVTAVLRDLALTLPAAIRHNLELDPEPALHFIFPDYNIAVPLRPGDILIFNPALYHGCSAKLSAYNDADVNLMSMYLKSAVVGGNNNSIPLSPEMAAEAARIRADAKAAERSQAQGTAPRKCPPPRKTSKRPVSTTAEATRAAAIHGGSAAASAASAAAAEEWEDDDGSDEDYGSREERKMPYCKSSEHAKSVYEKFYDCAFYDEEDDDDDDDEEDDDEDEEDDDEEDDDEYVDE